MVKPKKGPPYGRGLNIPTLPMAFLLTFVRKGWRPLQWNYIKVCNKLFPKKSKQEAEEDCETCINLKGPRYQMGLNIPLIPVHPVAIGILAPC